MRKILWLAVFLQLFYCGGRESFSPKLAPDDRFLLAKRYMEAGKYLKAQEEFKRLIFEYPGSDYVDDAQYYLAESYFLNKEYDLAILEYKFLIDNYRGSPYVDRSYFKVGLCYYKLSKPYYLDQTNTEKALDEIDLFLTKYPQSAYRDSALTVKEECLEKLAKKDLEAGKLYMRLGKYEAARIYFETITEEYPNTKASDQALFLIGISYEKEGATANAREIYEKVLSTSKDQLIISKARVRLEKLPE